ncbi:13109_t:CDS:2, partial [Funneliformis geosporum]
MTKTVSSSGQEAKIIENIESELVKNRLKGQLVRFFYSIPRVVSFLNHQRGSSQLPEFVSPELVENFSLEVGKSKENTKVNHNSNLTIGDLVKIIEGTFANYEGKITSLDERKKRVKIDIEFAGRSTPIDVPIEICQK